MASRPDDPIWTQIVVPTRARVKTLIAQLGAALVTVTHAAILDAVKSPLGVQPTPKRDHAFMLDPDNVRAVLAQVVAAYHIPRREAEVLAAALGGVPRRYLALTLGISENTIKTYVGNLTRRIGQRDLDAIVWWFRQQILKSPVDRDRSDGPASRVVARRPRTRPVMAPTSGRAARSQRR